MFECIHGKIVPVELKVSTSGVNFLGDSGSDKCPGQGDTFVVVQQDKINLKKQYGIPWS